ncbi:hypothetical protein [Niallia taxi]|nr:hypothetical protein [Niallia taxi]
MLCEVITVGIKSLPLVKMPRRIRGMQELELDTHELTDDAIV